MIFSLLVITPTYQLSLADRGGWSSGPLEWLKPRVRRRSLENLAGMRTRAILGAFLTVSMLGPTAVPLAARPVSRPAPGSAHLKLVAGIPYEEGAHNEHASIGGRDYVFTATQSPHAPAELRVIDVTDPEKPKLRVLMSCGRFQGNLQVSADRKILILGIDGDSAPSECSPSGGEGFVTIDISRPTKDAVVEVAAHAELGADYFTAKMHKGPYVYAVDMNSGLQIFKIIRQR